MIANCREWSLAAGCRSVRRSSTAARAGPERETDAPARQRRAAQDDPRDEQADGYAREAREERDPPRADGSRREAPDGEPGGDEDRPDHERRDADLASSRDLDERLRVEPRRPEQLELARAADGLQLAHPVQVAKVHRDRLAVRDDDVARDELDQVANRRAEPAKTRGGVRAVVAVAPEALGGDQDAAVVVLEAIGMSERRGARELREPLPVARAADVDLVEERGNRLVVGTEELEPLERVVVGLLEALG